MNRNFNQESKATPRRPQTRSLVMASLLAAICFGATLVSIPLPTGYGNLGDCLVILSGWILGPVWGAVAAGMGTALADVALGFGVYAPATFVIKWAMATLGWFFARVLGRRCQRRGTKLLLCIAAAAVAEIIMIGGYFVYECLLWGVASAAGALLGNSMQAIVGLVLSSALMILFTQRTEKK